MGTSLLHRHGVADPLCTSCGDRPFEETVTLCAACVNTEGVAAYCRGCHTHLRFSVTRAKTLFQAMGKDLAYARPGVVVVFLGRCPLCGDSLVSQEYPQRILVAELRHDVSVEH